MPRLGELALLQEAAPVSGGGARRRLLPEDSVQCSGASLDVAAYARLPGRRRWMREGAAAAFLGLPNALVSQLDSATSSASSTAPVEAVPTPARQSKPGRLFGDTWPPSVRLGGFAGIMVPDTPEILVKPHESALGEDSEAASPLPLSVREMIEDTEGTPGGNPAGGLARTWLGKVILIGGVASTLFVATGARAYAELKDRRLAKGEAAAAEDAGESDHGSESSEH
eukprot:TRINITY_DN22270_c0_g1_i1.p1 TRINITY_DN22270_c0_g1~~TRINITY_DN22270_c0_g1_i1.p1  ORF type:complete len:226 (-),score=44.32 TRINITY_DN22270_c0_g1_i1:144-821(-)